MGDWWDHVCPQPGIDLSGKYENPMLAMAAALDPTLDTRMRGLPGKVLGSEDCLRLAVYTPHLPTVAHPRNMPVMVYIHGGAFMLGGYIGAGPGKLLERDMVMVAIQYRLDLWDSCVLRTTALPVTWGCWTRPLRFSGFRKISNISEEIQTESHFRVSLQGVPPLLTPC